MSRDYASDAHFAGRFNASDAVMDAARTLAAEYHTAPISRTSAAALTLLTSLTSPAAAIEVGTGTGTSTLAIMKGMPRMGVLTSIDTDADRQSVARDLLDVAEIGRHRVRMIAGRGEDVLARLALGGYELVFIDADPLTYSRVVPLAIDRLAAGGLLVVNRTLLGGEIANPAMRTPRANALRTMFSSLEDSPLDRLLLPIDDGLLVLRKPR